MIPDLREIRNKVLEIDNRLNFLLEKKELNYQRTQPASPIMKAIVSNSRSPIDKFALYMIRNEDLDDEIQELRDSYIVWLNYYNEEIKRLSKYNDLLMIEFLKNELNWKWNDIDKYLHYGEGGSRKKYQRYKNEIQNKQTKNT